MKTRTIISFVIMVAGVLGLGFFTPWWVAPLWIVLVTGASKLNSNQSTFLGGFALAMVWLVIARYFSLQDSAGIISKTGTLLGGLSHQLMMVITLVIAFITGSLSGWLGGAFGSLVLKKTDVTKTELVEEK